MKSTLALAVTIALSWFSPPPSFAADPLTDATPLTQVIGDRLAIQIVRAPGSPEPFAKGLRWGPYQDGEKQKPAPVDAPWAKDLGLIRPSCTIVREANDPKNQIAIPPLEPWPSPQTAVSAMRPDGFHMDVAASQSRTSVLCTNAKTIGDVRSALRGILSVTDSLSAPTPLDAAKKGSILPYDLRGALSPKPPTQEGRPVTSRGRKPVPPASTPADSAPKGAGKASGAQ